MPNCRSLLWKREHCLILPKESRALFPVWCHAIWCRLQCCLQYVLLHVGRGPLNNISCGSHTLAILKGMFWALEIHTLDGNGCLIKDATYDGWATEVDITRQGTFNAFADPGGSLLGCSLIMVGNSVYWEVNMWGLCSTGCCLALDWYWIWLCHWS